MPNKKPTVNGLVAVQRAKSQSDLVVLAITFLVLFGITASYFLITAFGEIASTSMSFGSALLVLFGALLGGGFVFVLLLIVGMVIIRVQRQIMLGNALEVKYSDYAWLRDWANQVAAEMRMPQVEVFITQDPYINAYAYGFARPYNIVLNSATIRYLTDDELRVVVVHEMGHIKYGHTNVMVFLQPFLAIPFIGMIGSYISGFWRRRTELTCDRLALMYFGDPEIVKRALIKVHIGPDAAKYMNQIARQWQRHTADQPFNRIVETFSTHPFLVRRIIQLDRYAERAAQPVKQPVSA